MWAIYKTYRDYPIVTLGDIDSQAIYNETFEELNVPYFFIQKGLNHWELIQSDADGVTPYVVARAEIPTKLIVVLARRAKRHEALDDVSKNSLLLWARLNT